MIENVLNTLSPIAEAMILFVILGFIIGAVVNLQMQKNRKEKKEALFITVSIAVVYIVLSALGEVITRFVENSEGQSFSAIDLTLLLVVIYFAMYIYLSKAKEKGTGAYYFKLYGSLEDLEIWLNEQSQEGYTCVKCYPSAFLFELRYSEKEKKTFKTEYVSASSKEYSSYIEENEKKGWKSILANKNKYDGAKIAVFATSEENPDMGSADRHRIYKLEKNMTAAIIINIIISTGFILTNIFIVPNEPVFQFLTIVIVGICFVQIGLRTYSAVSKKEAYQIMK